MVPETPSIVGRRAPDEVRTRVVATLGPACDNEGTIRELIDAGVDVFRLNLTHGELDWHADVARLVRRIEAESGFAIGLLADLPGPKIRLGELLESPLYCQVGDVFYIVSGPPLADSRQVYLTMPGLVSMLQVGDRVLLADGTVAWRVVAVRSGEVECVVEKPGEIRSRSGVHVPGVVRGLSALTDEDLRILDWLRQVDVDFVGLSYASNASDVQRLREELSRRGIVAHVVTKIERKSALDNLDAILEVSDAVMIARGDLGVEVDIARMAIIQKEIIRLAKRYRRPVITATQMLESMKNSPLPTRAEATDVANAVLDGTDALMLSGETAVGKHPPLVVETMCRIAQQAELLLARDEAYRRGVQPTTYATPLESLARAAADLARDLGATLLTVTTRTGRSAYTLAKERCFVPAVALTDDERTWRALTLCWGTTPVLVPEFRRSYDPIRYLEEYAQIAGVPLRPGGRVVVLGTTLWTSTRHDMVVVHEWS